MHRSSAELTKALLEEYVFLTQVKTSLASVPGKPISANRGLSLPNPGLKFILRLDSVPESTINTNKVINERLNLIYLARSINSLIGGKNLIKTNKMADLNFAILSV